MGKGGYRGFQRFPRMRVLPEMMDIAYQMCVVDAIRRSREVDTGDLYGLAVSELSQGENSAVFADLREWIEGVKSGRLKGREIYEAAQVCVGTDRLNHDDRDYPSIARFNREFLNDKGLYSLLTCLIIYDAAKLDPDDIDELRGGERLRVAYGERRTRREKRQGVQIQAFLKVLTALDEPAAMEAADRYIEYRFLDHGSFPDYLRRAELTGAPRSERYLRRWFRDFDRALGYAPPFHGRPPKR